MTTASEAEWLCYAALHFTTLIIESWWELLGLVERHDEWGGVREDRSVRIPFMNDVG